MAARVTLIKHGKQGAAAMLPWGPGGGKLPSEPAGGPSPSGKPEAAATLGPTGLGDGQDELSLPMGAQR